MYKECEDWFRQEHKKSSEKPYPLILCVSSSDHFITYWENKYKGFTREFNLKVLLRDKNT